MLVDRLTLWHTNPLATPDGESFTHERDALLAALPAAPSEITLVNNEPALGIMLLGALAHRRFGDEAGLLHPKLARRCDRVVLTVAG